MEKTFEIGGRSFVLDQDKAEEAFAAKKVINGRKTEAFNLLPLKYTWAYDLYHELKAAHWSPFGQEFADTVARDREAGAIGDLYELIETAIGFFAPGKVSPDSALNDLIREKVTAPELKLVLGRRSHEETLATDCFLFLSDRLRIDPVDCLQRFEGLPSVSAIRVSAREIGRSLDRTTELDTLANQQAFARAVFFLGACFKGVQFHSLFLALNRTSEEDRLPATTGILRRRLHDESRLVEFFRRLFLKLIEENPEVRTTDFEETLVDLMVGTLERERAFARESLALRAAGIDEGSLFRDIEAIAAQRLADYGLTSPFSTPPGALSRGTEHRFARDFTRLTEFPAIDLDVDDNDL